MGRCCAFSFGARATYYDGVVQPTRRTLSLGSLRRGRPAQYVTRKTAEESRKFLALENSGYSEQYDGNHQ
jgi:hypothetical protein